MVLSLALFLSPLALGGASLAHADSAPCIITSFTASPGTITAGTSASLNWTTVGCQFAHVSGGTFYSNEYMTPNGALSTGPIAGTTTYTLYAYGSNSSTSAQTTACVIGGPYAYGCGTNAFNTDNVITLNPTNVSTTSARLNGAVTGMAHGFSVNFEYGTTPSLGLATPFQADTTLLTSNVSSLIPTTAATTYWYKIEVHSPTTVLSGSVHSFTTPAEPKTTGLFGNSNGTSSTTTTSTDDTGKPAAVILTVTNKSDKINIGDTVEDTVTYTNNTGKKLTNATLSVVLPQGFAIKQSTQGMTVNATTVTANLDTLAPGQTGSVFIEATVGANTARNETLVTNATLEYTLPDGSRDSAVGYVVNHASAPNVFAGFALGSGFFPSTIFGWLITVIIILTLILIARRIAHSKHHHPHDAPKHH